jgi:hypothetical protein
MNLQTVVVVLLRLVSLNFLLQAFYQITPLLMKVFEYSRNLDRLDFSVYVLLPLVTVLGLFVGAALVWVFAMPIAQFVTRGLPAELSFGALSLGDCYSIILVGLGLYYAVAYFPYVLNWTYYLLKTAMSDAGTSWQQNVKGYDVSQSFIPFIVGIVLFVNGRKWAVALAQKQLASPASAISTPENQETKL